MGLLAGSQYSGITRVRHLKNTASAHAYAVSTAKNFVSHWRAYLFFNYWAEQDPMPVNADKLAEFIVFLTLSDFTPSSITNYVNSVKLLYKAHGGQFWSGIHDSMQVDHALKAAARSVNTPPRAKAAFTPTHLKNFYNQLDMNNMEHLAVWAMIACAFFGMLRVANVAPANAKERLNKNPMHLLCKDITFTQFGMICVLRISKTNQTGQRDVRVPVFSIPGSKYCPVTAVKLLMQQSKPSYDQSPFTYIKKGQKMQMLHSTFAARLSALIIGAGLDRTLFAGHSLRRGGATYAVSLGMPSNLVKAHGDWRSDAIDRYIQLNHPQLLVVARNVSKHF